MRNVILTLFSAFVLLNGADASAQTPTFLTQSGSLDSVTATYTGGDEDLAINNYIKSASSTPVTLSWKVVDKFMGTNWRMTGLCDNITCHTNNASNHILNGAQQNTAPYGSNFEDFHVLLDAKTAPNGSYSWLKINLRDVSSGGIPAYERNLYFIGIKNATTGVTNVSVSSDNVVLFPNPAHDAVNVIFDSKAGVKTIAIYNMIGKLINPVYKPSDNNSARISLNEMPNGVYFMRLMDAQGNVLATRRFIRQ